jgi:hypothetical protein
MRRHRGAKRRSLFVPLPNFQFFKAYFECFIYYTQLVQGFQLILLLFFFSFESTLTVCLSFILPLSIKQCHKF